MAEIKPFIKCLHPLFIKSKSTGETLLTNCGKCKACLIHKAATTTLKVKLESSAHAFCFFITLTYDEDHIPLIHSSYNHDSKIVHCVYPHDNDRFPNHVDIEYSSHDIDYECLLLKFNHGNMIPTLCKRDLQLFFKRLRNNLKLYHKDEPRVETSFRYFACGEYGPVHYRPHYHILLWFENQETISILQEAISASWTFGNINASLSKGKSSSYVAGYLNSYCSLPKVLTFAQTRPFSVHSEKLGESVFKGTKDEFYKLDPRRVVRKSVQLDERNTTVSMWRTLKARYFPLCKDYSRKSAQERTYSYLLYDRVRRWTKEISPYKQAKELTEIFITYDFNLEYFYSIFGSEIHDLVLYFIGSLRINPRCDSVLPNDLRTKQCYVIDKPMTYTEYRKYLFNSLYHELQVSYIFLTKCCDNQYTYTKVLDIIDNFYAKLDYVQLCEQYKLQQEYLDDGLLSPNEIYYMYNNLNTDFLSQFDYKEGHYYIRDKLLKSPLFMQYSTQVEESYNKSIKHKYLNDKNKIFENK